MFLRRVCTLTTLAVLSAACSAFQPAPQPYPLPQPDGSSSPIAASPSEGVSWNTILSATSAPAGWLVYACENPTLLCVQNNGELAGTVELIALPVQGSQFEQMMIDAGISPDAIGADPQIQSVLQAWVGTHYATIQQDRQGADSGLRFSAQSPEAMPVGQLEGVRYEFTTTRSNGDLFERSVGYAATDGETLYVIVAALMNGDPTGTFSTDADLTAFEPHLDRIVAGLNLPPATP